MIRVFMASEEEDIVLCGTRRGCISGVERLYRKEPELRNALKRQCLRQVEKSG
jgi:hypothetical protein